MHERDTLPILCANKVQGMLRAVGNGERPGTVSLTIGGYLRYRSLVSAASWIIRSSTVCIVGFSQPSFGPAPSSSCGTGAVDPSRIMIPWVSFGAV